MDINDSVEIAQLMTKSGVQFGTSGARGLVSAMTDYVCYAYTAAFVQYLELTGQLDGVERVLELERNHPGGWLGKARVLLKRGEGTAAAEILEQLLRGRRHPYLYQLLGTAYRQVGDPERARSALARARPGSPPPTWPSVLDAELPAVWVLIHPAIVMHTRLLTQLQQEQPGLHRVSTRRYALPGEPAIERLQHHPQPKPWLRPE